MSTTVVVLALLAVLLVVVWFVVRPPAPEPKAARPVAPPVEGARRNWLIEVAPEGPRSWHIGTRSETIGRSPANFVQLDCDGASRAHCDIAGSADGAVLTDRSSSNGTRVNGDLVTRWDLSDGDVISIGAAELTYRAQGEFEGEVLDVARATDSGSYEQTGMLTTVDVERLMTAAELQEKHDGDVAAAAAEPGVDEPTMERLLNLAPEKPNSDG